MDQDTIIQFVRLSENATIPTRGSPEAAGLDLYSAVDITIPAKGQALVETDLQALVPRGTYGRVAPRSGLATRDRIGVGAGVIDRDYRGSFGVLLVNHGETDFHVTKKMRIAQLICERISYPTPVEVHELPPTLRGANGFGSTGR